MVRGGDGAPEEFSPGELVPANLRAANMWRSFRWHRGQRHFPGSYWSATTEDFVGYESRLELSRLLFLDHDPKVAWITSQPFLLEAEHAGKIRRHVPDYAVLLRDDSIKILDVKPAGMLEQPNIAEALAWAGAWFEACGWGYEIASEPEPIVFQNLRFLAGYRRRNQFRHIDLDAVCSVLGSEMPFGEMERQVAVQCGGHESARAVLFHLMWSSRLAFATERPLGRSTILEVA